MNREIFLALRDSGMEDDYATREVAVLQTKATTVEAAVIRIDEKFERIDESIVGIKETAARTDEKVNGLQAQNKLFIIPLFLLTLGAMFGLLTKGILWAVAP